MIDIIDITHITPTSGSTATDTQGPPAPQELPFCVETEKGHREDEE
jgi:hypothetical protein